MNLKSLRKLAGGAPDPNVQEGMSPAAAPTPAPITAGPTTQMGAMDPQAHAQLIEAAREKILQLIQEKNKAKPPIASRPPETKKTPNETTKDTKETKAAMLRKFAEETCPECHKPMSECKCESEEKAAAAIFPPQMKPALSDGKVDEKLKKVGSVIWNGYVGLERVSTKRAMLKEAISMGGVVEGLKGFGGKAMNFAKNMFGGPERQALQGLASEVKGGAGAFGQEAKNIQGAAEASSKASIGATGKPISKNDMGLSRAIDFASARPAPNYGGWDPTGQFKIPYPQL